MQLITAQDYERALLQQIPQAKRRIVIMVLDMTWGSHTSTILKLVLEAQQRGVKTHLLYDRYSWLPMGFSKTLPSKEIRHAVKSLKKYANELEAAGGLVSEVGKKWSLNPFANRQHAKVTLIDDVIYSFGGVNFADDSFGYADYMFTLQNATLADQLAELVEKISYSPRLPNQELLLNDTSTVLFDGGTPGTSIIYDRACELASRATQITYVSQMCPSGKLVRALKGKSICYFNRPNQMNGMNRLGLSVDVWRYRVENHYRGTNYIHAKFMLFKMQDGSRILLSGSNNFSWRGIAYGTKEIALQSGNPILWDELAHFMQVHIVGV